MKTKQSQSPARYITLTLSCILPLLAAVFYLRTTRPVQAQSPSTDDTVQEAINAAQETIQEAEQGVENALDPETRSTIEEIKKRIERTVTEKDAQVQGVLDDLSEKRRAMIGQVDRVTDEALTIQTSDHTVILPIDDSVTLLEDENPLDFDNPLAISDVGVGQWVTILGIQGDENELRPRYIFVSDESLRPEPQVVILGSIIEIDSTTLVVQPRALDLSAKEFSVLRTSEYQNVDGTEATSADFGVDMNVLAVGVETEDGLELKTLRSLVPLDAIEE